jgi:hypothetical protein
MSETVALTASRPASLAAATTDCCSGERLASVGENGGEAEEAADATEPLAERSAVAHTRGKSRSNFGQGPDRAASRESSSEEGALYGSEDVLGLDLHELKEGGDLCDAERRRRALEKMGDLADLKVILVVAAEREKVTGGQLSSVTRAAASGWWAR